MEKLMPLMATKTMLELWLIEQILATLTPQQRALLQPDNKTVGVFLSHKLFCKKYTKITYILSEFLIYRTSPH